MKPTSQQAARQTLLKLRAELDDGDQQAAESGDTVELDQAKVGRLSRMDAMQMQAMAHETQRRRQIQQQRVEAALTRIENGDYGLCCACGEAIAPARLRVDPAAPLCIDCANEAANH